MGMLMNACQARVIEKKRRTRVRIIFPNVGLDRPRDR